MKQQRLTSYLVLCVILILIVVTLAACGSADQGTSAAPVSSSKSTYEPELFDHLATSDELQSVLAKETGTSARVDEIAFYAKATAGYLGASAEDAAIDAIRAANPDFYESQEAMELFMFYGYYLDYAFDDGTPQSELGTDLCQAIKYVYRGAEKVEDTSTQENLAQIAKGLEQLP